MSELSRYAGCAEMNVPPGAKLAYFFLSDMTDRTGRVAVSVRRIAGWIGMSRAATRRNLRRLESAGKIATLPRYSDDGGRLSNEYVIIEDVMNR